MGLYLPYHQTHHKKQTSGIGLTTCIKPCVGASFRPAPSQDAHVFHARRRSGVCICQLRLKNPRLNHWVSRVSKVFVGYYCSAVEVHNPFPNASKQFPMMLKQDFRKRIGLISETGHAELSDIQSL